MKSRSTSVPTLVGLPDPEARLRLLVGAVLVEIHDEWQVGERRYLSEGSMALLIKPPASSEG
jgi:putative transposase